MARPARRGRTTCESLYRDRCALLASRRPAARQPIFFFLVDAWRTTVRQDQRAHRVRCGGSELSVAEPGCERVEIHRTTGADRLNRLPPRWSTTLVRLFGLFQRPILRPSNRTAVWRRLALCLPPMLRVSLYKPAGNAHAARRVQSAKDQDAAWWEREPV